MGKKPVIPKKTKSKTKTKSPITPLGRPFVDNYVDEKADDCWVLSIDIGIVNIGVVMFNVKTGAIAYADKIGLVPSMKMLKSESELTPRIYHVFFSNKSAIRPLIDKSRLVLIENQMKSKQKIVQYSIGAFCLAHNKHYRYISPRPIKIFYGSGKASRNGTKDAVRGSKKNHGANKKAAVELATRKWPILMSKIDHKKRDDVADALIQASWFSESSQEFGYSI